MKTFLRHRHEQRSVIYSGLNLFSLVLLVLQLWLFVSTLENLIDGRPAMAVPAAAASAGCLAVNIWMLVGIRRMESEG